ncbi:hypothetical protein Fmac_026146 [Flemingia macrophylla]|uniref:Protein NBR1 homolog n=1 Tax=Flemingia macrophylla TaxID=520843 RepID=A0ABD1LE47_9FABA
METDLVIKAKYGDNLRRFSARVDQNNQLDLNMVGLKAKICSIFNFSADADLTLRYVDEDGDLVTLADDDDLNDAMRQQLKFLRIDVHLNNGSGGKSNAGSSGSATPLRPPSVPNPFLIRDAIASYPLPEPVREALSNLPITNRASSIPLVEDIALSIMKIGQSFLNATSSKTGVSEENITPEAIGPQSLNVDSATKQGAAGNVMRGVVSAPNAKQQEEAGNVSIGVATAAGVAAVDLNNPPCDPSSSQSANAIKVPLSSEVPGGEGMKVKMSSVNVDSRGESSSSAGPNYSSTHFTPLSHGAFVECPFSGPFINPWMPPRVANSHMPPFKRSHSLTDGVTGMFHKGVRCDGCGVYPITGPRFKSKVKENYDLCNICFNEKGNSTDYIRMDRPASARGPSCVYPHPNNLETFPPRFLKKGACLKRGRAKLDSEFILDVNVIDGTMMAPSTAFTKIWRMRNNGTVMWPKGTQLVWTGGDMFSVSRSIDLEVPQEGFPIEKELDIAVDFTAPQVPGQYISYWRMATRSGHKFGQRVWVCIQVDVSLKDSFYDTSRGMNLNIPLDVSGSKVPRVIDINVQPIENDTSLQTVIPNAPIEPVNQLDDKEQTLELAKEFPTNEATLVGPAASAPATSMAPSSVSYPIIDLSETAPATSMAPSSVSYPIIDLSETAPATSMAPSSVSYPIIDLSETAPVVPPNQKSSNLDVTSTSLGIGGIPNSLEENLHKAIGGIPNSVEESLLKDLAEMGFNEVDLNKEVLRKNNYDLEQSLDDLCSGDLSVISEWDPILEELEEMGFRDMEMNKRLLKKNNGSIKRVVMDLINGEVVLG